MFWSATERDVRDDVCLRHFFVGFSSVDFFVGFALRAEIAFDLLDEPEGEAALFFSGMIAHGAFQAAFRQFAVEIGDGLIHEAVPPKYRIGDHSYVSVRMSGGWLDVKLNSRHRRRAFLKAEEG
jgi:hypothetical protein